MFDTAQHDLRLKRARRIYQEGDDFLMRAVVDDLMERLSATNRNFADAIALFGRTPYLYEHMQDNPKIETALRVEERDHLEGVAPETGNTHIARPELINLPDNSADLVLAPLSLHWSADLPGTLVQLNRVLRPDGLLMAALPGPDTLIELREAMLIAESETSDGAANRVDPFTDISTAGGLLQRTGYALPVVDQDIVTVRYNSALDLVRDLRRFASTAHLATGPSPALNRTVFNRLMQIYQERFADPDDRVRATFNIVSLSGWVPHESQQKPLKPGSAKTRLAEALKPRQP